MTKIDLTIDLDAYDARTGKPRPSDPSPCPLCASPLWLRTRFGHRALACACGYERDVTRAEADAWIARTEKAYRR